MTYIFLDHRWALLRHVEATRKKERDQRYLLNKHDQPACAGNFIASWLGLRGSPPPIFSRHPVRNAAASLSGVVHACTSTVVLRS